MKDDYATYYKNPKIDILFGFYGGKPIPTKQDKFKPLEAYSVDDNGDEIEVKNLYERKEDKNSIKEMKQIVFDSAKIAFKERGTIKKPAEVEVILSFSMKERRFKQIDIDNLSKTVLDGLVGVAFEDDSQVSTLIAKKHVHELKIDAILIGITELTNEKNSISDDIKLFGETEWK